MSSSSTSNSILYKFRSGTNFESLPLSGSSGGGGSNGARLLDIKRAIVQARNLGSGGGGGTLEFDLAVQDANTGQEYDDENAYLPRGARIVVRRVAAERGRGLLSRIANQSAMGYYGGGGGDSRQQQAASSAAAAATAAKDDFYTIRADRGDAEDEFFDAAVTNNDEADESRELEALRAVTDQAGAMFSTGSSNAIRPRDPRLAGMGGAAAAAGGGGMPPPPHFAKPPPHPTAAATNRPPFHTNTNNHPHQFSRNADPELRQQEAMMMAATQPKKRATGIPRTFLTLSAPSGGEGGGAGAATGQASGGGGDTRGAEEGGGGDLAAQLQPPVQAFQALVRSGGGQSTSSSNNSGRRDLDYALRLTATTLPDHLTCGICHKLAKMAMLVPWDAEGRPTCESCIRDGLVKGGYTCPLTGMEGVSPDDLFPNVGLRKAVEAFEADVMAKMEMIEKQIEADELKEEEERRKRKKSEEEAEAGRRLRRDSSEFEEDGGDGILVGRRRRKGTVAKKRKDDLFGGDDEFGGDVFDVVGDVDEADDEDEIRNDNELQLQPEGKVENDKHGGELGDSEPIERGSADDCNVNRNDNDPQSKNNETNAHSQKSDQPHENDDKNVDENGAPAENHDNVSSPSMSAVTSSLGSAAKPVATSATTTRREPPRRARGPPAGYVLGPAGGGVVGGVGGMAHPPPPLPNNVAGPAIVPPPPPPPPPRGVGVPPTYHQQGDNSGRGGGRGGRFYPNQFGGRGSGRGGGRFPQFNYQQQQQQLPQPFSPNGGGGRGVGGVQHSVPPQGYPNPQGVGGRGGGRGYGFPHGNQQWADNDNIGDWNDRKRSRDAMMGPPSGNMYQGGNAGGGDLQGVGGVYPQGGGWVGGPRAFDQGRGGFGGGGHYNGGRFQGRGGRGSFRGGRGGEGGWAGGGRY